MGWATLPRPRILLRAALHPATASILAHGNGFFVLLIETYRNLMLVNVKILLHRRHSLHSQSLHLPHKNAPYLVNGRHVSPPSGSRLSTFPVFVSSKVLAPVITEFKAR